MKPRALDLFCGAGGAAMGLHRAGFEVVGVDRNPQPEYPFEFHQADAVDFPLDGFDFIWASPPCQAHSTATRPDAKHKYACFIAPTRERLRASGLPYIIENVLGAPLINPVMLCGVMFGLGVIRHRLFESNVPLVAPPHVPHKGSIITGEYVTVAGHSGLPSWTIKRRVERGLPKYFPGESSLKRWQDAMGIDWMKRKTLTQAIPPPYSQYLGEQVLKLIRKEIAA